MAQVPNSIIVNPAKISATTVPEFIAYLKANPGKVTSATQGNGTTSHLTSEMLQLKGQVQVQHVPYRGTAPALQDLLAGNVDFMCDNLGVSLPLVEAGKLRLLGVATTKRMASLPNVPTIAETLPGFELVAWYAVVAPPKTPKAITEKINADINEALRHPELQDRLKKLSAEVVGGSTEADGEISARGSRSLECSDQGGQDQAAVAFCLYRETGGTCSGASGSALTC